jgi:hypothetical protein
MTQGEHFAVKQAQGREGFGLPSAELSPPVATRGNQRQRDALVVDSPY